MGHVLKASRVRLEEPVRMRIDGAAETTSPVAPAAEGQPRVRIAQSGPEFAVLEVTCSCGQVLHVRCDYAATGGTADNRKPGTS